MSARPVRKAALTMAAASAATAVMAGPVHASAAVQEPAGQPSPQAAASSAAHQGTRTWEAPEREVYRNDPWPFQGRCYGSSYAVYDSNTNELRVESRARNTSAISACRLKVKMDLHLSFYGYSFQKHVEQEIPTACSTTDYSCSSSPGAGEPGRGGAWNLHVETFPAGMTLTDITGYEVVRR